MTPRSLGLFLATVGVFAWLAMEALTTNSIVLDEYGHVPAGLSHLDLGDYRLYRESPPAVQMLIALPVWSSGARRDYTSFGVGRRSEWAVGHDFIHANPNFFGLFCRSRFIVLLLAVACGALMFWWAGEVCGGAAAVGCAALWLMDPNVLANSGIATIDIGTTAFGLLAALAFWRFLHRPDGTRTVLAGISLGLAQASKFSMLVLYPTWLALVFVLPRFPGRMAQGAESRTVPPGKTRIAAIFALSLLILNLFYGFQGTLRPLENFRFRSHLLTGQATHSVDEPPQGNRFQGTWLGALPVPLPMHYVLGFDSQKWEEELGFYRLSGGNLTHRGHWYSPALTILYKLPAGTLGCLDLVLIYIFIKLIRLTDFEVFALAHFALFFALLSSQTGLNWTIRYLLPGFPYLYLLVGPVFQAAWERRRAPWGRLGWGLILALLVWDGVSLIRIRPHYLTFGNELIGGPAGAQRSFLGSNFDWGQDLLRLRYWWSRHPQLQPLVLDYYGVLEPPQLGFSKARLPQSLRLQDSSGGVPDSGDLGGGFYWAISSNLLHGVPNWVDFDDGLSVFCSLTNKQLDPRRAIVNIGNSIYVFHILGSRDPVRRRPGIGIEELRECLRRVDVEDPLNQMAIP